MVHCGSLRENRNVPVSTHSEPADHVRSHVMALIALECEIPGVPPRVAVDRATASVLADALAHDLAAHVPELRALDFVFVGALYDQAQMLRPHWPLHAALAVSLDHLPRNAADTHVIALGAHDGKLPHADLQPEVGLFGSPMLVLPWLLAGRAETVAVVGQRLEQELLESGLIGAELALAIGEAFAVKTAHARHMTTLDLCALACAQYEHADLAEIWQIVEAALLRPDQDRRVDFADGSTLLYRQGVVRCNAMGQRRTAQCRAILAAHGLTLVEHETSH